VTALPRGEGTRDDTAPDIAVDGGHRPCVVLLTELRRRTDTMAHRSVVHLVAHAPAAPLDDLAARCRLAGRVHRPLLPREIASDATAARSA
jgi:hypothetical protein